MKRTFILLSYLALTAFTSVGCGKISLNLDGLNSLDPGRIFRFSKGAEFVAAAQQGERTANGYTVDSSMGSVYSKLEAQTPNGYKVYSSVEGHIISDEKMVQ